MQVHQVFLEFKASLVLQASEETRETLEALDLLVSLVLQVPLVSADNLVLLDSRVLQAIQESLGLMDFLE